jgi:3-methyladenine DNA glycosylase AlkD
MAKPNTTAKMIHVADIRRRLHALGNAHDAEFLQRFFKTGPGEYGGRVPATRRLAAECGELSVAQLTELLHSKVHEERLMALILLVRAFKRGDDSAREAIYTAYLANTAHINNWDLVDCSAEHIVGPWLADKSRAPLRRLAASKSIWERRIAVLATFAYIKQGDATETLRLARRLLKDRHDLIHKAVGWMLREVGKRIGRDELLAFLDAHAATMPRTMLRYAIEHLPRPQRDAYLSIAPSPPGRGLGAKRGFRAARREPAQRFRLASRNAHCK